MTAVPGSDGAFPNAERRVGKYRLLELVGRGAMGRVFAALDDHTGRKVAIKLLNADLEGEPDIRTRFFREAQAAARLGHRNVITIYDLGEDRGRPFIVMELLRGWTLPNYLNEPAAVDLERKVDLMVQLCDGMAVAHAAEIIHRDLKPGNLFVQADGLLKVLDFGVARLASSSMTTAGAQPGTLHYMSPEQARGEEIDKRSDIFSAGGVFYFMLTGRKPFPGQEWARVIRMLESEDPQPLDPARGARGTGEHRDAMPGEAGCRPLRRLPGRGGRSDEIPASVPGGDATTAGRSRLDVQGGDRRD